MSATIDVTFPGGKRVDAMIGGMLIRTDQLVENGGTGTAPEPFQLFLASIATCAGIYALEFCQARDIPSGGMTLSMRCEFDEKKQVVERLHIDLRVPPGFPEKYKKAVIRVMDRCSVKKHIMNPPEFLLTSGGSVDQDG
jgi:putative redox protein